MQKEVLYKYKDSVSDYQQKDQAIYNVEMQNPDIKQISKLSQGNVSFNIPQLNINYCNSFNENFNITIKYQPIEIYDLNLFITGEEIDLRGKDEWKNICVTNNEDENNPGIYTYTPYKDPTETQSGVEAQPYKCEPYGVLRYNEQYTGTTIYPKPHTFSLQQQSINSLINELNYPLKHIPYGQDPNNPVYHIIKQSDGNQYRTRVIGEIDISNQIYWDSKYNGKLCFHYNGIIIDPSTWTPISYGFWKDQDDSNKGSYNGGYHIVDNTNFSVPFNSQANLGYWPLFKDNLDGKILTYNNGGTFTYNYQPAIFDVYDLMNNIQKASEQTIYVKQLDSSKENYVFGLNNFYYANQLMGFMQSPQQIFDFLYHYVSGQTPSYSMTFYPQTQNNNYHIKLASYGDTNKYLKNVCAMFYLSPVNNDDGFDQYINRQVCLSKEFFLQIWREVYVMSPQLQSNTIIYKPENMIYNKQLKYTNTNNANGKDYINQNKNDNQYIFNDKLNCIAYYVNSVSFNNYVSLQNNYPLQYCVDQNFDVESLRSLTFILTDENGVVLPRLSEFKVYIQFQQDQNNTAQNKTTNFNRVLTDN